MAPEILERNIYSEKSEVYALAMICWEVMAGEPPFKEYKNIAKIVKAV